MGVEREEVTAVITNSSLLEVTFVVSVFQKRKRVPKEIKFLAQTLHEAKMGPPCIALLSWGKRDSGTRQREAVETKHGSWSTAHAEGTPNSSRNLDTEPRFCQNLLSGLELGRSSLPP